MNKRKIERTSLLLHIGGEILLHTISFCFLEAVWNAPPAAHFQRLGWLTLAASVWTIGDHWASIWNKLLGEGEETSTDHETS